jgi:hypothetical protein
MDVFGTVNVFAHEFVELCMAPRARERPVT